MGIKFFRRNNSKSQARKRRIKAFFRNFILAGLLLSVFVGAYHLSLHLKALKVSTIRVEGAEGRFDSEFILQEAGLRVGLPILSINLQRVIEKLKMNPWIDEVKLTRRLPHTLLLKITPYNPRMILSVNKFYYISNRGKIFKEVSPQIDSMDFPVLTGLSREEIEQDPPHAREKIAQALHLLFVFETSNVAPGIGLSEIHYDKIDGFSLFPEKERYRIIVGFDDFPTKLKRFSKALERLKQTHPSFASIDLNYEGRVILTM